MTEAARRIIAVLLNHKLAGKEGHRNLTTLRVVRNESRDVTVDGRFAACIANVHTLGQGVVHAIELDLELVVAEGEDAKLVIVVLVDAVCLRRRDHARTLRRHSLRTESPAHGGKIENCNYRSLHNYRHRLK